MKLNITRMTSIGDEPDPLLSFSKNSSRFPQFVRFRPQFFLFRQFAVLRASSPTSAASALKQFGPRPPVTQKSVAIPNSCAKERSESVRQPRRPFCRAARK